jgi:adenylate cyclase
MTARSRWFVAVCGLLPTLAAAVLCALRPALLTRVDYLLYDRLVRLAGPHPPGGRVLVVDVDERSLAAMGQWPWRREAVAELIARLRAHGAIVIALDIVFAEPDRAASPGADPDAALAGTIRAGRVVLGYAFTFDEPARGSSCLRHPLGLAVVTDGGHAVADPFFRATGVICNLPALTGAAPDAGFLNAAPDEDGILRRVPLLVEHRGLIYPSLALAAVSLASGARPALLRVSNVDTTALVWRRDGAGGARRAVPLDGRSMLLVRYRGPKRTFPYVSAIDVLTGTTPADLIRDRIVFVGTTALGTREVVATPLDTLFTGVEVQATVADNLLQQDYLHQSEYGRLGEALAVLAAGLAATLAGSRRGLAFALVTGAALSAGIWAGALSLLSESGILLSPLYPAMAVAGALAGVTVAHAAVEHRRAEHAGVEKAVSERLMVQTLLSLVETRDPETGRHSRRTRQYARILATELARHPGFRGHLTPERIELLAKLAPLHDIGKVGVPDSILNKPGPLTPDEMAEMRNHTVYGRDVIVNAQRAAGVRDDVTLRMAKDIVYSHHERWDGTGYPEGLRSAAIPVAGRLIAVVDAYDAMISPRPYNRVLSHDEAIAIVARGRATQFDPDVVDACLKVEAAFRRVSAESLPQGVDGSGHRAPAAAAEARPPVVPPCNA